MTEVYVLHSRNEPGLINRVFATAIGKVGYRRLVSEMGKYSVDAQKKMMITGFTALESEVRNGEVQASG